MKDLWDDPDFIEKRMHEQIDYLTDLCGKSFRKEISDERYNELWDSGMGQFNRFNNRLLELGNEIINRQNNGKKSSEEKGS